MKINVICDLPPLTSVFSHASDGLSQVVAAKATSSSWQLGSPHGGGILSPVNSSTNPKSDTHWPSPGHLSPLSPSLTEWPRLGSHGHT